MLVDDKRPILEPLDPEVHVLDAGIQWRTSQLAYAWVQMFMSRSKKLRSYARRYTNVHPQFTYLIGELYARLFQSQTPSRGDRNHTLISALCKTVHSILEEATAYAALRSKCDGDPLTAKLALHTLLSAIDELQLPGSEKEPPSQESSGSDSASDSGEGPDYQSLQEWLEDHQSGESRASARAKMQKAAQDASDQAQQQQESFGDAFGDTPANIFAKDQEGALAFQEELQANKKMQEMMQLLGRWKDSIHKAAEDHFVPAQTQPWGVEFTKNPRDLTPSARAMMANPELESLMLYKLTQGRAPGYKRGEMEGQEQGGVFIAVDCSGSMQGTRLRQAMSFAGAILVMGHRAGRDVRLCLFNTQCIPIPLCFDTATSMTDTLRRLSKVSAAGGTAFDPPLRAYLQEEETFRRTSDLVFVSDGLGPVTEKVIQEATEDASLTYLVMEGGNVSGLLEKYADQCIQGVDLLSPSTQVSQAAASVVRGL